MSRKTTIDRIYPRDWKVFGALSKCGHASHEQLREFVRDKRLSTYEKAGLIGRVPYHRAGSGSEDRTCYRLTSAGREFCRKQLHMSGMYHAQSVAHDMGLADRYFSLSQEERDSWQTESQVRDMYEQYLDQLRDQGQEELAQSLWDKLQEGETSPPDAVYTTESGEQIVLEVVTNNYGETELAEKSEFSAVLGLADNIDFVRV